MEEFGSNKAQKDRISRALLLTGNQDFSSLKDIPANIVNKNTIDKGICGAMSLDVFKKLKINFEKKSLFFLAKNSISNDNYRLFFYLIDNHEEIKEMQDFEGNTLLHHFFREGYTKSENIARKVISNLNINSLNYNGRKPDQAQGANNRLEETFALNTAILRDLKEIDNDLFYYV